MADIPPVSLLGDLNDLDPAFITTYYHRGHPTGDLYQHNQHSFGVMRYMEITTVRYIEFSYYGPDPDSRPPWSSPPWYRFSIPTDWVMWPIHEWAPYLVDPNDDYADDYHYDEFYWTGSRYLLVFHRPDQSRYARWISPDATYLYHRDLPPEWTDDPLADWAEHEIDLATPDGDLIDQVFWFEDFEDYLALYTDPHFEGNLFIDWIGYDYRWGWRLQRRFRRFINPAFLALFD